MKDITIVTSLQDIRRHNMDGRKWDEYLEWFSGTLQINAPMVVFVDESLVKFVKHYRGDQKLNHHREIRRRSFPTKIEWMKLLHLKTIRNELQMHLGLSVSILCIQSFSSLSSGG